MLNEVYTAIITPYEENGVIDFAALTKIIHSQVAACVGGIVVAGSTGEISSLSVIEYRELIRFCTDLCRGKIKCIAGCGHNNINSVIEFANIAEECDAGGIMCVTPFYCKPSQSGLYQHFKMIHNNTGLPIMLYSVPSRTVTDFTDETLIALSELERIVGFKDASNDINRVLRIGDIMLFNGVKSFCGNDENFLAYCANGGNGIISVVSNIIPKTMNQIWQHINANEYTKARAIQRSLIPLYHALNVASNPVPIKYAMSKIFDNMNDTLRLPLHALNEHEKGIIDLALLDIKDET